MTLRAKYQSARMSKITNDGLTWSSTGCFIAVPYGNSGRQRVKKGEVLLSHHVVEWCSVTKLMHGSERLVWCLRVCFVFRRKMFCNV